MLFNEKLKYLRKANNMSQRELAEKLIVSRQAVSRWETGESMPDADIIIRLSKLFDTTTDKLLNNELEIGENLLDYKNSKTNKRCGIFITVFSSVSIICLCVVSSIFPVYIGRPINDGEDILYKASLFTFLNKHHLNWLFALILFLLIVGIFLILENKIKAAIKTYRIKTNKKET